MSKKIIILIQIAKFYKKFKNKRNLILVSSKRSKNAQFLILSIMMKILLLKIKNQRIDYIINFCGYFENQVLKFQNLSIIKIKKFEFTISFRGEKIRVITITSMDSANANTNDVNCSLYKSLTSKLIKFTTTL